MTTEGLSWALAQKTGDPMWTLVLIHMAAQVDDDRGHLIHCADPALVANVCDVTATQLSWAKWNLRERGYIAWFTQMGDEEVWRVRPKADFDPCQLSGPWRQKRVRARRAIPKHIRAAVFLRDGHRCTQCSAVEDLTLDHIHPYSLGGPDTAANLRVLCRPCNSRKGASLAWA